MWVFGPKFVLEAFSTIWWIALFTPLMVSFDKQKVLISTPANLSVFPLEWVHSASCLRQDGTYSPVVFLILHCFVFYICNPSKIHFYLWCNVEIQVHFFPTWAFTRNIRWKDYPLSTAPWSHIGECYGLNACGPSRFTCCVTLWGGCIFRGWLGHADGAPIGGISSALMKTQLGGSVLCSPPSEGAMRRSHLWTRRGICWCSTLGLLHLQNVGKKFPLCKPPALWYSVPLLWADRGLCGSS